ncbi:SAF domain-containing protein [Catenulispora pinisilvae]|uniref:SAF domain-containing protein n=1 Tax=Catenulispora pinisilvae TaxID=2705253 RepID=UPI0018912B67|nr:SAF domain-containing protein [Catenulispora pinisilvae]
MSKDRSSAGGSTASVGAYQPGGQPLAAGNRLPTASRERKPALAALAVLLILAGALATMLLVSRSGNRVSAIEMTHTVAAGTKIEAGDMAEVRVAADDSIHYVLFSQVNQVTGSTAGSTLVAGSLLVSEMLGSPQQQALKSGQAMIGYLFKEGQFPENQLSPGDVVELWQTNGGAAPAGGNGANNQPAPNYPTKPLCQATILAFSVSGDALDLTLSVPEDLVGQLEALAGNVSVAKAASAAPTTTG